MRTNMPEIVKAECKCLTCIGKHDKKGYSYKPCANVRHHEIDITCFSVGRILMFKDDEEKGDQCHKLPHYHKY